MALAALHVKCGAGWRSITSQESTYEELVLNTTDREDGAR